MGPQWVAVDELWGYVGSTKTTLIPHSAQGGVPTQPPQQFCPFGSHTSRKQQNMGLLTENSCGAHVGPYGVRRSSDPLDLQISLCPHWAAHHAGTVLIRRQTYVTCLNCLCASSTSSFSKTTFCHSNTKQLINRNLWMLRNVDEKVYENKQKFLSASLD